MTRAPLQSVRARLPLALAGVILLAGTVWPTNAPAGPTRVPAASLGGAQIELSECVASRHGLQVLVLVDSSASLRKTDPQDRRVTAMASSLRGLSRIAAAAGPSGAPNHVDVALAGFGERFEMVHDWSALDPSTIESLIDATESFADRDKDVDTDYYDALLGARDQMADHARSFAGGVPCQALLWFTDGEYEVSDKRRSKTSKSYAPDIVLGRPGSGAKVVAIGTERLCAPDGVVDGLRSDGVKTFTVALSSGLPPEASDLLVAIANGSSGAVTCGERGGPATGTTLLVDDLASVITAFDGLANTVAGAVALPRIDPVEQCAAEPCQGQGTPFALDPGMGALHILVRTGTPDAVVLRFPGGGRAGLRRGGPGSLEAGPLQVAQSWLGSDLVAVDVDLPNTSVAEWAGTGSLFVVSASTATAIADISVVGGLVAVIENLPADDVTTAGKNPSERVQIRLLSRDGVPVGKPVLDTLQTGYEVTLLRAPAPKQQTPSSTTRRGTAVSRDLWAGAEASTIDPNVDGTFEVPSLPPGEQARIDVVATVTLRSGVILSPISASLVLAPTAVPAAPNTSVAPTAAVQPTLVRPSSVVPFTTPPAPRTKQAVKASPPSKLLFPVVAAGVVALAATAAVVLLLGRRSKGRAARVLPQNGTVRFGCFDVRVRFGLTPDLEFLDGKGGATPFRVTRALVDQTVPVSDNSAERRVGPFLVTRDGDSASVRADQMHVVASNNRAGTVEDAGRSAHLPLELAGAWAFATRADRLTTIGSRLAGLDDTRTVDLSTMKGLADPSLDGVILLLLGPDTDPGQVEQSARHLLPTLAQALVALSQKV